MVRGITSQFIELLNVFSYCPSSLLQSHELAKLNLDHTRRNMMSPKSGTELRPRDSVSGRLHGEKSFPPRGSRASQLMSSKEGLLLFGTGQELKLCFH